MDYGTLHSIAIDGFSRKCSAAVPGPPLTSPHSLRAFRYFDPDKDRRTPVPPTPVEIDALMTRGKFEIQRLLSTFPNPAYVIPRSEALDEALKAFNENRTLLLHSRIGNGKTLFRHCLSMKLNEVGHRCYVCRDGVVIPSQELDFLKTERRPL